MTNDVNSEQPKKPRIDIGRIGENLATNEFIWRGFLVTHLDKGTRGVSANADLMVGHPRLARPLLVQVKSTLGDSNLDWLMLGGLSQKAIDGEYQSLYNHKPGFKADVLVALVIADDPSKYRMIALPISTADELLLPLYRKYYKGKTKADGELAKLSPMAWVRICGSRRVKSGRDLMFLEASKSLAKYELPTEAFRSIRKSVDEVFKATMPSDDHDPILALVEKSFAYST